jgi:hypothetical protein
LRTCANINQNVLLVNDFLKVFGSAAAVSAECASVVHCRSPPRRLWL